MKKVLLGVYIILFIVALKLVVTFVVNEIFVSQYNKGNYSPKGFQSLFTVNYPEPYIAHYNYGNTLYKNNEFEGAIYEYEQALDMNPPADKECDVHINLALAMLQKHEAEKAAQQDPAPADKEDIDVRLQEINKELDFLETVIHVLTEDGCAIEGDEEGHSPEAEKLLKELEKKKEELEKQKEDLEKQKEQQQQQQQQNEEGQGDAQEDQDQDQGQDDKDSEGNPQDGSQEDPEDPEEAAKREKEKDIQEKLEEVKKEAGDARDDYYEAITGTNRRGYHSYDGKKW